MHDIVPALKRALRRGGENRWSQCRSAGVAVEGGTGCFGSREELPESSLGEGGGRARVGLA